MNLRSTPDRSQAPMAWLCQHRRPRTASREEKNMYLSPGAKRASSVQLVYGWFKGVS